MEKRYLRRDGGVVWVSTAVTPIARRRRPAECGDRDRPRHQPGQASRAGAARNRRSGCAWCSRTRASTRSSRWTSSAASPAGTTAPSELTGYAEGEIVGRSADLIFIEEDRVGGAPEREAQQALAEGRAADERWHLRKDGSRFWGSGVMMAMRDSRRRRADRPAQDLSRPDRRRAPRRRRSRPAAPSWCRRSVDNRARARRGRGGEPCQGSLPRDPLARAAHAADAGGDGAARARAQRRAAGDARAARSS